MDFNKTSDGSGLCQEVDGICGTNTTSYPLVDKARRANMALSRFVGLVLSSDNRWQFDDTNYTDLPIGTTNLVSGQGDYSLATSMLKILKVEMLDSNGDLTTLQPIDITDQSEPLESIGTSGTPKYYDKHATSVILYPTPNYNSTNGLKVYYQRDASYFVSTDTTKKAGIPSIFHEYIALKMAEPYIRDKSKDNYVSIRNEITKYEEERIPEFYAKRNKDERAILTGKVIDYN